MKPEMVVAIDRPQMIGIHLNDDQPEINGLYTYTVCSIFG